MDFNYPAYVLGVITVYSAVFILELDYMELCTFSYADQRDHTTSFLLTDPIFLQTEGPGGGEGEVVVGPRRERDWGPGGRDGGWGREGAGRGAYHFQ